MQSMGISPWMWLSTNWLCVGKPVSMLSITECILCGVNSRSSKSLALVGSTANKKPLRHILGYYYSTCTISAHLHTVQKHSSAHTVPWKAYQEDISREVLLCYSFPNVAQQNSLTDFPFRLMAATVIMFSLNQHRLLIQVFFSKIINPLNSISLYCEQLPLTVCELVVCCSWNLCSHINNS